MRKLFFVCLFPVLLACNAANEPNTINVTGQGKIKVVPDMVELSLRAYSVKPAMKDAVTETQAAVNEIIGVCRKYVVDPSDIKVSSISTNKAYEYRNGKEQFTGYDALQVLDVTLKDISKIEEFTEELLATKISKIENIRYNHTKADSILREVNLIALEDARKTAEKMCLKMNASLGKIVYLSNFENNQRSRGRGMRYSGSDYEMNLYNKSFGGRGFKMTAEILEFEDAAYASFTLQ
ncbi:MAG TPA: SIMPL domain-containing protein [Flavisolibacter sp.]|jgi:uncharacterized protein YggE|nr:SIMPL domain-containing protein [Flavisolibacter sp.]